MFESFFCGAFFFLSISLSAQPGVEWEGSYGGDGSEEAQSVEQTEDGGYIVAGYSDSADGDVSDHYGKKDYWLLKLDSSGQIQWEKSYGGSSDDMANSVQQTEDGGYIVAGVTHSTDGDVSSNNGLNDYWLLKLDGVGNIEWERSYGGSSGEVAKSVKQTDDGGYVVGGNSVSSDGDVSGNNGYNDYWVLKLDSSGSIQWDENYGGSYDEYANSLKKTQDGGFILVGGSESAYGDVSGNNGKKDYWVVKLDDSGNIQWEGNYGGSEDDGAGSVLETDNGGYIVVGYSGSFDGDVSGHNGKVDYWIVKLDASGNILWEKAFGGSKHDVASSIGTAQGDGYIVAGWSNSYDGDVSASTSGNHFWLLKLDTSGGLTWEKSYLDSCDGVANSLQKTSDGGYVLAGHSSTSGTSPLDQLLLKLGPSDATGFNEKGLERRFSLHPNPTKEKITLEVPGAQGAQGDLNATIRSVKGRTISKQRIEDPSHFQIELGEADGIYFLELKDETGRRIVRKVVKE